MEDNIDKILRLEENQFIKDQEIERIMSLKGTQDPLLILGVSLDTYVTLEFNDLRKDFRTKSRLVHPDKNTHEQAREAFDELQRAWNELEDPQKKRTVINYIKEARENLLQRQGIKVRNDDYKAILQRYPNLGRLIQLEFIRLQQELKYRDKTRLKNEVGREMEFQLKETQTQKDRAEFEKQWDEGRSNRIDSWKKFEGARVKKKKPMVLGQVKIKKK